MSITNLKQILNIQYYSDGFQCLHISRLLTRNIEVNKLWRQKDADTAQKMLSFPLRISSADVAKSAGNCGFGYIY